jgi:hypothetical protein
MTATDTIRPPLAANEAAIARLFPRDPRTGEPIPDATLDGALTAMRSARLAGEQIAALVEAVRRDPTRSGPAGLVELRRAVPSIGERAARALDAGAEQLRRAVSGLEAEMAPKPPASPEQLQIAGEIRAALARMDPTARAKALGDAIAAGDEAVVSAALRGGGLLVGMSSEQVAGLRQRWSAARHPEAYARAERLNRALAAVETAGQAVVGFVGAAISGPGAEAAVAAADAAQAALSAAARASA